MTSFILLLLSNIILNELFVHGRLSIECLNAGWGNYLIIFQNEAKKIFLFSFTD